MKMKLISAIFVIATLGGCDNAKKEAVKMATDGVVAIHDEVMPKMADLGELQDVLSDSIAKTKVAATTKQMAALNSDLKQADSLMYAWMEGFSMDTLSKMQPEVALKYLNDQRKSAEVMRTKALTSIEAAKTFLKK